MRTPRSDWSRLYIAVGNKLANDFRDETKEVLSFTRREPRTGTCAPCSRRTNTGSRRTRGIGEGALEVPGRSRRQSALESSAAAPPSPIELAISLRWHTEPHSRRASLLVSCIANFVGHVGEGALALAEEEDSCAKSFGRPRVRGTGSIADKLGEDARPGRQHLAEARLLPVWRRIMMAAPSRLCLSSTEGRRGVRRPRLKVLAMRTPTRPSCSGRCASRDASRRERAETGDGSRGRWMRRDGPVSIAALARRSAGRRTSDRDEATIAH